MSSSSSSSSSAMRGHPGGPSSSSGFAFPGQAHPSASSSSSASSSTHARTQTHVPSHRHTLNEHSFIPPPPPPTQQQQHQHQHQDHHHRQPLARHQDLEYDDDHRDHDHEYDHASDEESEGDPMSNEMEYYLQRCSICFDSRLDFCLELCRDQFCRDCFQKYVKEVVSNSWGLNVTMIKCPVCQDPLPLAEWSRYVDQATLAQYQQYNQPFRSFSRFCNECDNEVVISQVKQSIVGLPSRDMLPLFEALLEQLKSLLVLAGLNPEAYSSSSSSASLMLTSMDGRKRQKHGGGFSMRDIRAQELVQRFIKDYQSFCGIQKGTSSNLPSLAQSYFSNLAMRALGGGPVESSVPASSQPQQSISRPSQPGGHGAPPGGHSIGFQQNLDGRSSHHQQDSVYRVPSSLFQRKHHPVRSTGVLEMYKGLTTSLIELFDLKPQEQSDSMGLVARTDVNSEESQGYGALGVDGVVHSETTSSGRKATVTNPCGEVTVNTFRIPKRTLPDRSKIITRGESKRQLEVKKALVRFSKELSSLEDRPEQWKELQFLHVRWCRWDWCNNCDQELCLQCGVSSHHESETCFEHMSSIITNNAPTSRRSRTNKMDDNSTFASPMKKGSITYKGKERFDLDTGTMQWKLANTNPCPNCCILIHRDDGCNKVDCMLCGYRFCWVCREAWDVGCGFFKCRLAIEEPAMEKDSEDQWEKGPEQWDGVDAQGEADQVETLAIAMGEVPHTGHGQADAGAPRHDRRSRRSEDVSAAISEKPEIGVPNVFMIQAKRSRA